MLKKNAKIKENPLQRERDKVLKAMAAYQPDDPEYTKYLDALEKIDKLMTSDKKKFWARVSPDAVVGAGVTLGGILLLAAIESSHVVSQKQFSLIPKAKI